MARQRSPRREFWLSHLRKWRVQGGTLKAYAQANELPIGTFYAAKSTYTRCAAKNKAMRSASASAPVATLLPVQLAAAHARELTRVNLPNGVCIEVPGRLAPEEWRTLLDASRSGT